MITLQDLILKTNAISLHEIGITGKGITVALLDSGVDVNHEIFNGINIKSFQLVEGNINDGNGHGTNVASILTSISPEINILNIKILDDNGDTKISTIIKGLELAINENVDIINLSVGEMRSDCPINHPLSLLVEKAIERGIIVVCASGNAGKRKPHIPASCPQTIAVGSVNHKGRVNKFSGTGPVCGYIYPDCVSWGEDILGAFPNNQMGMLTGTSQAAPQVSGMLALMKQGLNLNSLNRDDIELFLSQSCDLIESSEKNNSSGWGLINIAKFYRAAEMKYNNF